MQMDEGLDTGDILMARRVTISSSDTSATLHDTLAETGAQAIVSALAEHCRGGLPARTQPTDGVTYAAKLDKGEAVMDFSRSAVELDRQVRGLNPWPVAETRLAGERIRVWSAACGEGDVTAEPGTVLGILGDSVEVATGDGRLVLHQIQRDGGKRVPAGACIRSLDALGGRFGS